MKRLVQNPHVVSAFFVERAKKLFHETYGDTIKNSWFVYEWQGRGSVHIHGLLWMGDAPALPCVGDLAAAKAKGKLVEQDYAASLRQWAAYYDDYITAYNPAVLPRQPDDDDSDLDHDEDDELDPFADRCREYERSYYAAPPVEVLAKLEKHVCAHQFGELDEDDDMKYLANFCQRHTKCLPGVCLKVDRKTGQEYCKNGAPWNRGSSARFVESERNKGELEFVPIRNDSLMNGIPKKHFVKWRANADMRPVFSMRALDRYLTKYLTKAETPTDELRGITDLLSKTKGPDAKASSAYIKALNKAHNRDYSAQEVTHHLLKLPGSHCTRRFAVATTSDELDLDEGQTKNSAYKNYLERADLVAQRFQQHVQGLSFYDFVEKYDAAGACSKRQEPAIPRIMPQVYCSNKRDLERFSDWCESQIRQHFPHTNADQLEQFKQQHGSAENAVRQLVQYAAGKRGWGPEGLCREWLRIQEAAEEDEAEGETDAEESDEDVEADEQGRRFPEFARAGMPGAHQAEAAEGFTYASAEEWTRGYTRHGQLESQRMRDFIADEKKARGDETYDLDLSGYDASKLQDTQLAFYELLKGAMQPGKPIRAVIRGGGGTGKSYAINCFRRWLSEQMLFSDENIAVLAPTGTAAFSACRTSLDERCTPR